MHLRRVVGSALAAFLAIGLIGMGGWWANGRIAADTRSSLTVALDALPMKTQVAGFTDWAHIRSELGIDMAATTAARAMLADDAALLDLTTRSVIGKYAEEMHDVYGWSAADLDWETYGQAMGGAVMVAQLGTTVSFDEVRARLIKLGYVQEGRVWSLGEGGVPSATPDLVATLKSVILEPRRRLIIAPDRAGYVSTVLESIDRDAPSLLANRSAQDVTRQMTGADSALLQAGPFACESTSFTDRGADVEAQARAALERAGPLAPPRYAGRALYGGPGSKQVMRFVQGFGSPSVATAQLVTRRRLAAGPFIGGAGRIEDSLTLTSAAVQGTTTTLQFNHDPDSVAYMSGNGPLLFAGCAP
ncbi:hypothetical protein [Aeromicrobium sp.]|uniref:hypothetical protein n=1 Tax=Aeromicrobium sp. TaxID=1871063 RepID=UPI003C4FCBDA